MHAHRPSQTRWVTLALLFAISIVRYIDRVNISVTARQMMPALGLSNTQMGQMFSAFVLGYALFQIPGGWLGDRWGARLVLTVAVIWWSIFTALTAVAATLPLASLVGIFGSLFVVRFLVGVSRHHPQVIQRVVRDRHPVVITRRRSAVLHGWSLPFLDGRFIQTPCRDSLWPHEYRCEPRGQCVSDPDSVVSGAGRMAGGAGSRRIDRSPSRPDVDQN